jgi:hypothetical protein
MLDERANRRAARKADLTQAEIEQQAATDANLMLAATRRRRRLGSLIGAGRTVLGAPAGGGSPAGGGTALSGGGIVGPVRTPATPSRGSAL